MFEFLQSAAEKFAKDAADFSGVPQTVYRSFDTQGWEFTTPFNRSLRGALVHVTMLPNRYFH